MQIKEGETFAEITIVTMLFNMGMDNLNLVKGTDRNSYYEYYVTSLIQMGKSFRNVVCYCDKECADYLREEKLDKSMHIIEMQIHELKKYSYMEKYEQAFDKMQRKLKLRQKLHYPRISRRTSCIVKDSANPSQIAKYTVLNHAKIDLLSDAAKRNPYKTKYFYWLDAGCLSEKYNMLWENWDGKILHRPKGIRVTLFAPKWSALRKRILWTKENIAYCFIPDQMAAAFFGGSDKAIAEFKEKFDQTIQMLLKHNLASSEQGIITYMVKQYPKLFDIADSLRGYPQMINDVANGESL